MYLSRIQIDDNDQKKIKDLNNLESYHGWIESSFPNEFEENIRTRKLWRIDTLFNKRYLLLISRDKPSKEMITKYGISKTLKTINYNDFLEKVYPGMVAKFRLVANPTYSKSTGKSSGKRGKPFQCVSIDGQMQFLEKRAQKNGFSLIDSEYTITHRSTELLKKENRKIYISKVCYEGRLIINDAKLFTDLLCNGLGHNKSYGFGMITIIPEDISL
ncbi:type I-E CRISPR-associated protein Cas6/Cse3/CasE [Nicoliella lavandulae]|uniref:Type I-E CRISPR-associated protein Cas6/Cse3/CasE n=1 Tax=Nicoliella lavandulae TaxID=3082954 RepID=A0ABU8SPC2_9LACO